MTRKIHGNVRSSQGYLLTKNHYLTRGQEWRLGQSYLGMMGMGLWILMPVYIEIFRPAYGTMYQGEYELGFWSDWTWDLRIVIPIRILAFVNAIISIFRTVIIWSGIGRRADLGE